MWPNLTGHVSISNIAKSWEEKSKLLAKFCRLLPYERSDLFCLPWQYFLSFAIIHETNQIIEEAYIVGHLFRGGFIYFMQRTIFICKMRGKIAGKRPGAIFPTWGHFCGEATMGVRGTIGGLRGNASWRIAGKWHSTRYSGQKIQRIGVSATNRVLQPIGEQRIGFLPNLCLVQTK